MDFVELLKSTSMRSSGEIIARLIIDESTIKTAKASGNMVVQIVNKGTMDIKFAKVILEKGDGYVILSNPRVYVGEVESDDIETIDFVVAVDFLTGENDFFPNIARLCSDISRERPDFHECLTGKIRSLEGVGVPKMASLFLYGL